MVHVGCWKKEELQIDVLHQVRVYNYVYTSCMLKSEVGLFGNSVLIKDRYKGFHKCLLTHNMDNFVICIGNIMTYPKPILRNVLKEHCAIRDNITTCDIASIIDIIAMTGDICTNF